jgi:hypothetical protein
MFSLSCFGHQSVLRVPPPAVCFKDPPWNGHFASPFVGWEVAIGFVLLLIFLTIYELFVFEAFPERSSSLRFVG